MRLLSPFYQLLLWAALLLLGASFIQPGLSADIHIGDTYFVFNLATLLRAMAFGTFLLWLLYLVNKPFLYSAKMTRIHVIVTLVSLVAVVVTTLQVNSLRKELTPAKQDLWIAYYRWQQVEQIALVILFAAQVVFLMHLGIGIKRTILKR